MDAQEFKIKFLPQHEFMYRTAWRLTHNAQDAEDLVQDAFLKLWSLREKLGEVTHVEAYCQRLVKNRFLDKRRAGGSGDIDIGPPDDLPLASDGDAAQPLEHEEMLHQLNNIVKRLPRTEQIVFMRRDIENAEFEEIAHDTGLTEGSVRALLSRARQTVRKQFKEWIRQ